MHVQLLTDYEKTRLSERQPLPEAYLGLSDEEMDARIAARAGGARRAPRDSRPPLPAGRGDQVRRLHGRLLQAVAARGATDRGRLRRLLRRALHGRKRRHPRRTAPAGDPARPGRRLLDGRHGRHRPARGLLAGNGRAGHRPRRGDPGHVHQLHGGHQRLLWRARRDRLHVEQRRPHHGVGLGARREAADAARPASRPEHGDTAWACRSTRWSCGIPTCPTAASIATRSSAREAHPVEGPLQRAHALHREADRAASGSEHPGRQGDRASRVHVRRGAGGRREWARPSPSSAPCPESPEGSVWAVGTEIHLVNRLAASVAPARTVVTLDALGCLCSTMFRVSPNHLLWILEGLASGEVHNRIVVPEPTKTGPGSRSTACSI